MHFSHCFCNFPSFSLQDGKQRKKCSLMNGNLCTWKHQIIHPIRATSINVSLAFLLLCRFLPVLASLSFVCATTSGEEREKYLSVSGFWWQKEICDDVHLNKQLNEAELFASRVFFSFDFLAVSAVDEIKRCQLKKSNENSHVDHACCGWFDSIKLPIKRCLQINHLLIADWAIKLFDNLNKNENYRQYASLRLNLNNCLHCWTSTLQFPPDKNVFKCKTNSPSQCLLKNGLAPEYFYLFLEINISWLSEY